jgi:hypothetical protein
MNCGEEWRRRKDDVLAVGRIQAHATTRCRKRRRILVILLIVLCYMRVVVNVVEKEIELTNTNSQTMMNVKSMNGEHGTAPRRYEYCGCVTRLHFDVCLSVVRASRKRKIQIERRVV